MLSALKLALIGGASSTVLNRMLPNKDGDGFPVESESDHTKD
jgi:hypothetical protein